MSVMAPLRRRSYILAVIGFMAFCLWVYVPVQNGWILTHSAVLGDYSIRGEDSRCTFESACKHGVTLSYSDRFYVLNSSEPLTLAIESFKNLTECLLQNRTHLWWNRLDLQLSPCTSHEAVSRCLGCTVTKFLPRSYPSSETLFDKHTVKFAIGNKEAAIMAGKVADYFDTIKQEPVVLTVFLNLSHSAQQEPSVIQSVDGYHNIRQLNEYCSQKAAREKCRHCTPRSNCTGCETTATVCEETRGGSMAKCSDEVLSFNCKSKPPDTFVGSNESFTDNSIFLHIVRYGTVNEEGNVQAGSTHIVPAQCNATDANMSTTPFWTSKLKEVFVISQRWGQAYFHSNIEDLPRLMPYLDFLLKHPDIKIHVKGDHIERLLPLIGLSPERLVRGDMWADVIYLPQGGGCGWLHATAGRLLREKYAKYIHANLDNFYIQNDRLSKASLKDPAERSASESEPRSSPGVPNSIVLIQRSRKRWLAQHEEVKQLLEGLAQDNNVVFEVFSDRPLPSFNATMATFASAKLVVAPHGAGLSNMIFSRAGTKVVEVLCNPRPNLCFRRTLGALGQPYVGMLSLMRSDCGGLFVDLDYLKFVVLSLLSSS